ncbi:hypothetical protein N2152v2_000809 [Parachlorella kessleri]
MVAYYQEFGAFTKAADAAREESDPTVGSVNASQEGQGETVAAAILDAGGQRQGAQGGVEHGLPEQQAGGREAAAARNPVEISTVDGSRAGSTGRGGKDASVHRLAAALAARAPPASSGGSSDGSRGEGSGSGGSRGGRSKRQLGVRRPPPATVKKISELTNAAQTLRTLQTLTISLNRGKVPLVEETTVFPPGNEDEMCVGWGANTRGVVAPVVTVTFDRDQYLDRMLQGLLAIHNTSEHNKQAFPLFVSQDFDDPGVQTVVFKYLGPIKYLQHVEREAPKPDNENEKLAYYRIANHYKFIFQTFFNCFGYERLIILEDDMALAPDFFSYFEALAPVLDKDPTLYCVSSWNDHGQDRFVRDQRRLYRSDFFPGLGWMTNRATWQSVQGSWPRGYWDDWMRQNATRQGRQCIRPEVCRTYNFGEFGSSEGQFFRQFLQPIVLANESVPWGQMDMSYLEPGRYARDFAAQLAAARVVTDAAEAWAAQDSIVIRYHHQKEYERLAGRLRMMKDWKDGVPRGAYQGVVTVRNANGALLFVAPAAGVADQQPLPAQGAVQTFRRQLVATRSNAEQQQNMGVEQQQQPGYQQSHKPGTLQRLAMQ